MEKSITAKALRQKSREIQADQIKHNMRIAILGYRSTQFLSKFLIQAGAIQGLDIEIYEADYIQVEMEVMNPASRLYTFKPDFIWIINSTYFLQKLFYKSAVKKDFGKAISQKYQGLAEQVRAHSSAQLIFNNFFEIPDSIYGHFSNKTSISFLNQLRRINVSFMDLAESIQELHLFDLNSMIHTKGLDRVLDSGLHINADIPFSMDFEAEIAWDFASLLTVFKGEIKKCLILDLDNTLWGGVIGDDGLEGIQIGSLGIGKAFTELQGWAKALKERGIILAICSKNTEEIAKEVFEKHEEMILRLDDIAVFVANWSNKADNIRHIQQVLNIGFDSMVFLDDNPAERALVQKELPEVSVPDLPQDPAEYLPFLRKLRLFETLSLSSLDKDRTRQYQEEAQRRSMQSSFSNMEDYLISLNMKGKILPFQDQHIARISQLSQRSNQFNLRTIRYTESEIKSLQENSLYLDFQVSLEDTYGTYGLISIVLLKKENSDRLFIENWLMSCRVLKRGLEKFVLNHLLEKAREIGIKKIVGEYLPTAKNKIVEHHYKELGFESLGNNQWELEVENYEAKTHFINI
ncbi:MAG: HAD-IIIC family phosphatase [Bacteroidia bacterium]|nr:HAD-IIIC family phosphatase [Bacteroidia bacterium]